MTTFNSLMTLRHQGDAWVNPFAVVYEPKASQNKPTIRSVKRIMDKGIFKGVQVKAQVDKRKIEQFVLMQESANEKYINESEGIEFTGHFAVITLENDQLAELYIGQGNQLAYKGETIKESEGKQAAYSRF